MKTPTKTHPFVVFVTFPSSSKEYAYLCNIPGIRQGSEVMANNTKVTVVRTAASDSHVTKYVRAIPDQTQIARTARRNEVITRLHEIEKEKQQYERLKTLSTYSPEAKRLVLELKKLGV